VWVSHFPLLPLYPSSLHFAHAGKVQNGLKWHQDGEHLIYPLGSTIVVKNIVSGVQSFLSGHSADVTCVALSRCGRYIASGQRTEMGNKVSEKPAMEGVRKRADLEKDRKNG
jgi:hypothetical protein